ncbi:shikimate dehydrogenase [Sessilibacter sp. MAH4]
MTDNYAVFGNPIAHSKSPDIHRLFSEQTQQTMSYTKQLVELDEFEKTVTEFASQGGCGLNITVPFKLEAFDFADELTSRAQNAGAVNTLLFKDNKVIGDNTDGFGLVYDITENLGWSFSGKKVLILGAGGAVRGILQPILEQHPNNVCVANRTASKAVELAEHFSKFGSITGCGFSEIEDSPFDIIINGTSASISGDLPPLPEKVADNTTHAYDLMYGKEPTVFMKWAASKNCTAIADGLGMLVCQAAESFYLWRGVRPETKPVITYLRNALNS